MQQETIFDVIELSEYLRVKVTWVYKQVHLRGIPYFKCGKYVRFKKSSIDSWIEKESIKPTAHFNR